MIVRQRVDLKLLAIHLGPVLGLLLAYDTIVTLLFALGQHWVAIENLPLPLLGSAIALIVTFRNNAAYNRWWEARGLWGLVVNNSRSLARGLLAMTQDAPLQSRLINLQIAYAVALRCSLLNLPPWPLIRRYLPQDAEAALRPAANVPAAIQNMIGIQLGAACRAGKLDSIALTALDRTLSDLANAQGGLERIRKTPLPRQYEHFPRIAVAIYCFLLPLSLVATLGSLTPLCSTLIGFMFLSLDITGRDLQDPFAGNLHDVPMASIVRTVEIDLLQSLCESNLPPPVSVKDGVLW